MGTRVYLLGPLHMVTESVTGHEETASVFTDDGELWEYSPDDQRTAVVKLFSSNLERRTLELPSDDSGVQVLWGKFDRAKSEDRRTEEQKRLGTWHSRHHLHNYDEDVFSVIHYLSQRLPLVLEEREEDIVRRYYGLWRQGVRYQKIAQISEAWGISGARVTQIRQRAMSKIRKSERATELSFNPYWR